jgi:hypothetical protein
MTFISSFMKRPTSPCPTTWRSLTFEDDDCAVGAVVVNSGGRSVGEGR